MFYFTKMRFPAFYRELPLKVASEAKPPDPRVLCTSVTMGAVLICIPQKELSFNYLFLSFSEMHLGFHVAHAGYDWRNMCFLLRVLTREKER